MKTLEIMTTIYGGYPMTLWIALAVVSISMAASLWIALGKIDEKD
ncbi:MULTISPECIES: hypothetical protein [Alcaligenes]|nr:MULTISPECIES: hypothetical protein [Alcaligenes]UYY88099.1 hypothetical protein OKX01_04120 [Alcaligenes sp. SMD-FA]